ncbi:hypothetical protein B0H17DRAFT_1042898 [Mycena rosella]|uniref:Uncharacterized protein n=1 Tax=Mycena rosella TaxID=1033263 RepID=A0AAD7GN18_MYCRO|nr:hypothetical protein B0H17DRAFT_1042898 [Mycena rosella]
MEAFFDNKTNIVNARICAALDSAPMYTVETTFAFAGRGRTVLRDANPLPGATASAIVGAINWGEKSFEVGGYKHACAEMRRSEGGLFHKTKFWRWSAARKEYEITYTHEEWKATLEEGKTSAGRFSVPFRPHLFSKSKPTVLHLTATALTEDEVFLILVFIYEEVKRQDKTVRLYPLIYLLSLF